MDLSASGAEFICLGYESPVKTGLNKKDGCYYQYDDRYGYPTIGFGHLVLDGEDFSKGLSSDEVNQLFVKDSKRFVNKVNKYLKVGVSQNQFDALVSLAFNIGGNSEPIRKLNAGTIVVESDFSEYCKVRDPHDKARKVVAKGLLKRRKAEWIIFSKNIYDSRH